MSSTCKYFDFLPREAVDMDRVARSRCSGVLTNVPPGEGDNMLGETALGGATFREVFLTELSVIRPQLTFPQATGADLDTDQENERLARLFSAVGSLGTAESSASNAWPLSALCLSGGGIRSASFHLGVLQGLARIGLLGKFDYVSGVGGGACIGSWLLTWMTHRGVDEVVRELGRGRKGATPFDSEPKPVINLRRFTSLLSAELGLFSGNTWSAVATILRNLLALWMVVVPALAAAVRDRKSVV